MNDPASQIGKVMIAGGLILVFAGALFLLSGKIPLLGKLPGDIHVEGKGFSFYFPIVTCLVVSLILTLVMWIVNRLR